MAEPNIPLTVAPLPQMGYIQPLGVGAGLATGIQQGVQAGNQTAQTGIAVAELQKQKQMMQIEKNLKMMEIGSKMVLEGGPDTIDTGQNLIRKSYPFLTGQELPANVPIDKDMAKDFSWYADRYRENQLDPSSGLNAKDAVFGVIKAASRYGKTYQERQMQLLKDSPMYGEATASLEPGTSGGLPSTFNPKSGAVSGPGGSTGQPFVPAATSASTQAENQRKVIDENEKYKTSVTPFINAHNNFKNMQKIMNQAQNAGTNVDPWSFLNSYVHTVDPNFSGVLNAQTYKDLRVSGSPLIASMPWGEKYLTTSKLDPSDAMQMLQIAKGQDKIYSKTANDYADMTKRHIQSLGGDPTIVKDFMAQAPITRTFKSGRTLTSHDGGVTWQSQ